MNFKSLLPLLAIGGALYLLTKGSSSSTSGYTLVVPASAGGAGMPAHPPLYMKSNDVAGDGTAQLYFQTGSGMTRAQWLLDVKTGTLIG